MTRPTLLTTLRDAAADAQDELIRFNLNLIASEMEDAIIAFVHRPTAEHLERMIGHWSHGQRMIGFAKEKGAPVPCEATQ